VALLFLGGGFLGDFVPYLPWLANKLFYVLVQLTLQLFYAWWNFSTLFSPMSFVLRALQEERHQKLNLLNRSPAMSTLDETKIALHWPGSCRERSERQ
jgi:hypothetical protein